MTDPRLGDQLFAAVRCLPAGSGVVFRHYLLDPGARRAFFVRLRHICSQRGHMLILADTARLASRWQADGFHGRTGGHPKLFHSAPVHNAHEIRLARRCGAHVLFLSPLHQTRSHPGQRALGPAQFARLARLARPAKVIALGGMSRAHAAKLPKAIAHGWAAIDAFKR